VGEAKAWAIIAIPILGVVGLGWWLATRASSLGTTLVHANAQKVLLLQVGSEPSGLDPPTDPRIPESTIISYRTVSKSAGSASCPIH
jgi:hypothetical protein